MDKDMHILIVDDFSTMRRITKNLLRELGFNNTAEADDGQTALPMLRSGKFDFLVTDWSMPGMDGLTLLKTVRADEKLAEMPGRRQEVGRTHADYFARILEAHSEVIQGTMAAELMLQIRPDRDNFDVAWRTAIAAQDLELLGRLVDPWAALQRRLLRDLTAVDLLEQAIKLVEGRLASVLERQRRAGDANARAQCQRQ